MSDITASRKNIQVEETRYRSAVSESVAQKLGGSINFINTYQHSEKQWFVNGKYGLLTIPFNAIDGLVLANFNLTIINAFMFVRQAGSGGDTTLDIKYSTTPGGAWTSIFSTKPSINYAAGDFAWCYVSSAFSNTTAPVLSTTSIDAGWVMRCDITSAQSGDARGCGLVLHYKPR